MAFVNPNKLSGLSPVRLLSGAKYDGKGNMYVIPTSDSTNNYFVGDLVQLSTTGGGDVNGLPLITIGAPSQPSVGVIAAIGTNPQGGPYLNPANLGATTFAPITKTVPYYCLVHDDPNIIFEIQEGTGTALATAVVGLNAQIHAGAGTTNANPNANGFFLSSQYLDNAVAPTTTATFNLKIISLAQRPDNHFVTGTGTFQKWWVLINNHIYRGGTTAP